LPGDIASTGKVWTGGFRRMLPRKGQAENPEGVEVADPEAIRDFLQRKVDEGLPGVFVFIEESDGTTEFMAAGVADAATSAPMSPDRYYRVGSTTKTFTAVVVLQLVAERRLELSDLVAQWFPDRPVPNGESLTVEHLLRMRSGLFDFAYHPSLAGLEPNLVPHSLEEAITLGLDGKPNSLPGERFSYCNTNFCLLEHIVEQVTERSFQEELTRRIIDPLQLAGTIYPPEGDLSLPEPYIRGYDSGDGVWRDCSEVFFGRGDGALVSQVFDLAKFFRALLGGRLLPDHLLARMRTVVPDEPPAEYAYGLGLIADPLPTGTVWGHSGRGFGYAHHPFLDPNTGRFAVWMLNGTRGFPDSHPPDALVRFTPEARTLAYR
jgi:D-alanyl-D-alanine carboxypeptidase